MEITAIARVTNNPVLTLGSHYLDGFATVEVSPSDLVLRHRLAPLLQGLWCLHYFDNGWKALAESSVSRYGGQPKERAAYSVISTL